MKERVIAKQMRFGSGEPVKFDRPEDFAATAILYAVTQLLIAALDNGVTPRSLRESVVHMAEQAIRTFEDGGEGEAH